MKALIQAGGAGTRLQSITGGIIPKPMVKVLGKPLLQYQIENLKDCGIKDITIVVSPLGKDCIESYFKDGKDFGVSITYFEENEPLGTGGVLYYLQDKMDEDFVLLFGDLMLSVDWNRFHEFHKSKGALISAFAHPNSHPYDSDLLIVNKDSLITSIDSKNNVRDYYYRNLTNAGLYILSKEVFAYARKEKIDFEKVILREVIEEGKAYAYISSEYVKDCGTPERYNLIEKDQKLGFIEKKNLKNKQKAIFLDRDGTLNKFGDFVTSAEKLELMDDASISVKEINSSSYLAIIITNQPVIARGDTSFEEMDRIMFKLQDLLGNDGAYIDDIFICPHHPHSGYPGEVKELKIDCDCRKPKIGLILQAKERFNLDLKECWFIGDTSQDVKTANNAGCHAIRLTCGDPRGDLYPEAKADYVCSSLKEAVDVIIKDRKESL